ncbi:hypothetical protein LTR66_006151 [Elasticomyces elasticus]|nr:hypothetical protein LTR66_006151 [Elasticomyces elasticus]
MEKSKKEDFRMEEELRSQKAKYEESSEDVYRRMIDIKEAEVDSVADLTLFLEAELTYYERCRDVLTQLKRDWPATHAAANRDTRRGSRARANTANSYSDRFSAVEEEGSPPPPETRPTIRSNRLASGQNSPRRELPGFDLPVRPINGRTSTFEGPRSLGRDSSPASMPRLARIPTDPSMLLTKSQLRPVQRDNAASDVFGDPGDRTDNPSDYYGDRSASPANSFGSSRTASWSALEAGAGRKAPPPPPPSRSKKPPPPPPLKRSALSTSEVPYA